MSSGEKEDGGRIFQDLMKRLLDRSSHELTPAADIVFKDGPLPVETAMDRFQKAILQRQQEHGLEHPLTQRTIITFADLILCLVKGKV